MLVYLVRGSGEDSRELAMVAVHVLVGGTEKRAPKGSRLVQYPAEAKWAMVWRVAWLRTLCVAKMPSARIYTEHDTSLMKGDR